MNREFRAVQIAHRKLAPIAHDIQVLARWIRRKYRIEPLMSIAPLTSGSALCVVTIRYQPGSKRSEQAAGLSYRAFAEHIQQLGYSLYRFTTDARQDLTPRGEYTCLIGEGRAR